jgi:hypothetical protein
MIYRILLAFAMVSSCDSNEKRNLDKPLEPVFEIQQLSLLEETLTESSGVLFFDGKLYTHSDMAGVADLLELNIDGTINNTISYQNAIVKDWEDIASDDTSIYIADIGNNLANRTDLRIFKISRSQLNNPEAPVETIKFSFNDQMDFGNDEYNQTSYDVEALAVKKGKLYLFTKDWLHLNTNIYKISNEPGSYPTNPIATLNIGGLVTGATTNPDGNIIVCGYSPTLSPFVADIRFKNGIPIIHRKVDVTGLLGFGSQVEGIAYTETIDGVFMYYLTSEKFTRTVAGQKIEFPATLYGLKWNE